MDIIRIVSTKLLLLVLMVGLTACTSNVSADNEASLDVAAFQLYLSGMVIAADQSEKIEEGTNCFAEAGLNPTIIKRSKGPEIVDALVGGSAEVGTLAITPQVLQALQGEKLVNIGTIQTTDKDIKVVGLKSAGVNSGEDLRGKRVGYVGGTIGEIFLERYLDKYGIGVSEISGTSGGPAALRDLLLNKSVDAIVIWEPIVQDLLMEDSIDRDDLFIDVDTTLYTTRMNIVARPDVLENKRKEVSMFMQALQCGEGMIINHPDEARERIELWLDRKIGTLVDVFDEATFRLTLNTPVLLDEMQEEAKWAKRAVFNGGGEIPASFTEFIDSSFLKEIDPDKVVE